MVYSLSRQGWNSKMSRDLLLLLLGLDAGLSAPHLGTLASDVLTFNWSSFVNTLRTDALGFLIELIFGIIIWLLLRKTTEREKTERNADKKAITDSIDNLANQLRLERESRTNNSEPKEEN
jgi:hypothetical protein